MSNLNIRNIPTQTHQLLKKQAEKNHRSLNQEVLHILEQTIGKDIYSQPAAGSLLARVRENRKKFKGAMTIEEIDAAKREGRP